MGEIPEREDQPEVQQPEPVLESKTEDRPETELTEAQIEKIMEKVQDINKPGTTFHSFFPAPENSGKSTNLKTLEECLQAGILGFGGKMYRKNISLLEAKSKWYESIKNDKEWDQRVWPDPKYRHRGYQSYLNRIGEEISVSVLKEDETPATHNWSPVRRRVEDPMSILIDDGELRRRRKLSAYRPETGEYTVMRRIAPRLFTGVICKSTKPDQGSNNLTDVNAYVKGIVSLMKKTVKKPSDMLPIYDYDGDLLWPQKMNHEEVKQFLAERNKDKESTEK